MGLIRFRLKKNFLVVFNIPCATQGPAEAFGGQSPIFEVRVKLVPFFPLDSLAGGLWLLAVKQPHCIKGLGFRGPHHSGPFTGGVSSLF